MKKILFLMALSVSFLFSAINLQTASKKDLVCLKGIGEKKADAIILYRKKNKLKSADDLIKLKGFGKGIIEAVKKGTKTVKCGGKKTTPKKVTKKTDTKKSDNKTTDKSKKVEKTTKKDNVEKPKKEANTKEKKEDKKQESK